VDCIKCGNSLKEKSKRVRTTGSTPFLLELIGVLLILFTFSTVIGPIVGLLFIILGHNAAYKKIKVYVCKSCKTEFPEQESS
jgi:predicted nucleic-acid-binding Zn-ribbon protein